MTRHIFFDVMDTLVRDPALVWMTGFFGLDASHLREVLDRESWLAFERGEMDESTFLTRMFLDRRSFDRAAFVTGLSERYGWIEGVPALLEELSGLGLQLHTLSNYPSWHRHVERCLGLSRWLRWTFVSWQHGARKPDAVAYEIALQLAGAHPEGALFVDDRLENCEAARTIGMRAVHFVGVDSLRRSLRQAGLQALSGPPSDSSS